MQKLENAIVRVYLADGYWKMGVLYPYFEGPESDEHKPMFFRADNCDFDVASRCYVFRLPQLGDETVLRDVYIPEQFVVGIAIRVGDKPAEPRENMRKVGFV